MTHIIMPPRIPEMKIEEIARLARAKKTDETDKEIENKNKEERKNENNIITRDDNPPQTSLTSGWLYVPSIGIEFAPDLNEFNSNWYDTHRALKSKGFVMPTPAETWALIFEAKAHLDKPEFRKLYKFFTEKTPKNTWHSEWQDAFFKKHGEKMYMHGFKDFNPRGEPEFSQGIDITGTYLTEDCYANISNSTNITPNGLCSLKDARDSYVKGENFYSWPPRDGRVVGFCANSHGASFMCYGGPLDSLASLGVRYARRVAPSVQKN